MKTTMSTNKYVADGATHCPVCRSEGRNMPESVEIPADSFKNEFNRRVSCSHCDSTWVEQFSLDRIHSVKVNPLYMFKSTIKEEILPWMLEEVDGGGGYVILSEEDTKVLFRKFDNQEEFEILAHNCYSEDIRNFVSICVEHNLPFKTVGKE